MTVRGVTGCSYLAPLKAYCVLQLHVNWHFWLGALFHFRVPLFPSGASRTARLRLSRHRRRASLGGPLRALGRSSRKTVSEIWRFVCLTRNGFDQCLGSCHGVIRRCKSSIRKGKTED